MSKKILISHLFSLCFLLTPVVSNAQGRNGKLEKNEEIRQNIIYKSCGSYLFEQDSVIETDAYKNADQDEKAAMLESEFNRRRRRCFMNELFSNLATMIPAAVGTVLAYKFLNPGNNNPVGGNNINVAGIGMGGYLFMTVYGDIIRDAGTFFTNKFENVKSLLVNIASPATKDPLEKYEIRYIKNKQFLKQELQEILEDNFINARNSHAESSLYSAGETDSSKSPIQFAKHVLALPTSKIDVEYNENLLDAKLGTFNPKVVSQLKRFAVRHEIASTGDAQKKIVAYFEGPPGVGKTMAAENIAVALKVPFKVINLAGKTVDNLSGTAEAPGLLLEAMFNAKINGRGALNMMILFDEIDRALGMTSAELIKASTQAGSNKSEESEGPWTHSPLLVFLLSLIEPGQKSFYSPYLGVDVDISNIGFILAGNHKILDKALSRRLEVVYFEGYSAEFKKKVVSERIFNELLKPSLTAKRPLSESDFDEGDWQRINQMIDSDQEPGFQEVVRFLENYIADKVSCKYLKQCESFEPQAKETLETKVENEPSFWDFLKAKESGTH